jgi:hypothetical protein
VSENRRIARWESKGHAHIVELWKQGGSGYCYRAIGAGGYLGHFPSDADAIAVLEPRLNDFQPDCNSTPMKRVYPEPLSRVS